MSESNGPDLCFYVDTPGPGMYEAFEVYRNRHPSKRLLDELWKERPPIGFDSYVDRVAEINEEVAEDMERLPRDMAVNYVERWVARAEKMGVEDVPERVPYVVSQRQAEALRREIDSLREERSDNEFMDYIDDFCRSSVLKGMNIDEDSFREDLWVAVER